MGRKNKYIKMFGSFTTAQWTASWICHRVCVNYQYRNNKCTLNRTFRLFCLWHLTLRRGKVVTQRRDNPTYAHMGDDLERLNSARECSDVFLDGQVWPLSKGAGPQSPPTFWPPTHAHLVWQTAIKICMEQNFTRWTMLPALVRNFGDTNADARYVCGS